MTWLIITLAVILALNVALTIWGWVRYEKYNKKDTDEKTEMALNIAENRDLLAGVNNKVKKCETWISDVDAEEIKNRQEADRLFNEGFSNILNYSYDNVAQINKEAVHGE